MRHPVTISITIATSFVLTACELFVIGSSAPRPQVIERSQRTSMGVTHLFKAELDSNNTTAATELMVHSSGRKLLAVEKYELADEMARWQKLMARKPITKTIADTLADNRHRVVITLDYIRSFSITTLSIDDAWFVTRIEDTPTPR